MTRNTSPDSDSFLGCEVELIGGLHVEEVVPVVGVRHDAVDTLAEQGVLVLGDAFCRIAKGIILGIICSPFGRPEIGVCLIEALLLQAKLLTGESLFLQVL